MCNANGDTIRDEFWLKTLVPQYRSCTTMRWHIQLHTDLSTFYIWWTGIKLILQIRDDGTLIIPLGPWLCDPKLHLHHDSYIHHTNDTIIAQGNDDMRKVFQSFNTTFTQFQFCLLDLVSVFNYSLHNYSPCEYSVHDQYISVWCRSIFTSSLPAPLPFVLPRDNTISLAFQHEKLWYQPFITSSSFQLPPIIDFQHLTICSDGGVWA
jgi:hypothetical protein